jgi:serine protease inhibitor
LTSLFVFFKSPISQTGRQNVLASPLSVPLALALTAAGAVGDMLSQLETASPQMHSSTTNCQAWARNALDTMLTVFSHMATLKDGNLAISTMLQKTFIDVNETGTRAAAVTVINMVGSTATPDEPEVREVILDRPFVYFILDNMTPTPLFAGTITDMEQSP